MTLRERSSEIAFGGPATYRIVVQGIVSESWHRRLDDLDVTTSSPEIGESLTVLRGRIRDQAALHGLLDTLYALHLPILEVTRVDR